MNKMIGAFYVCEKGLSPPFLMMTLAGIAVAVGRVIDDSIVVIENIYRRTLTSPKRDERMVLTVAKEVGGAITSSTLTTIAVFGPLSFVPGIIGRFFAPFGITVIVALAFSLIVSLTVVPLLAKLFLLRIKHKEVKESWFEKAYKHTLSWVLNRRAVTIVLAVVMPMAILSSLPFLFSGGLLGLYLTGQALGMPALVGFLMLIGIVVTNAIVLMERVKQNEKKGMEIKAALLEAGKTRFNRKKEAVVERTWR